MTVEEQVAGLRWGIIGTGGIARGFAKDLTYLPGSCVVAVGSRTRQAADAFGDALDVPRRHATYADLVADPDVEAVYVATPHPWHAEHALLAIEAGKAVLVEKPFTMDADEARQVADAARAAGVFCMEAMWTRFLPHMVRLREALADGAVGTVRTVSADHGQYFVPNAEHRLFNPGLGGGALLDLGVYPVSFASMILGMPTRVTAASDPAFTGVDATTSAILQYEDGAHAVLTCTLESATPRDAFIAGTEGAISIEPTWYVPTRWTLTRRDGYNEQFDGRGAMIEESAGGPRGKGMRLEAAEVARCIDAGLGESPVLPLSESVEIMALMDAIRAASTSSVRD